MKTPPQLIIAALLLASLPALAKDNDRVQFGRSVVVEAGETVNGDVVCVGCSITVRGTVMGDAVAIGGPLFVDGVVNKDVSAIGGNVELGPNARVGNDVAVIAGALQRDPAAVVSGEVTNTGAMHAPAPAALAAMLFFGGMALFIPISIGLALLCYVTAGRNRIDNVVATLRAQPGISALAGLGVLIAAFALSALFGHMRPLSGFLTLALWLALLLGSVLGYTGLSAWFGRRLSRTAGPVAIIIIGAVVLGVLQALPFLGLLFGFVFSLLAIGSAVLSGYGSASGWLNERLGPPPPTTPPPSAL